MMSNPANEKSVRLESKDRIPMSVPMRHLEVNPIPGYHLHWFLTSRVGRAIRAGYTYVEQDEVDLNNYDLAGDASSHGSSDLGSRVSISASVGGDSEERLYLMKVPEELWEADQEALEARNEGVAAALRGGRPTNPDGRTGGDTSTAYVPDHMQRAMLNMFTPKRRR